MEEGLKKVYKLIIKGIILKTKESLIDYNDMAFEKSTMQLELECLNDDSLLDEISHLLTSCDSEEMESILVHYFKNGNITEEQRQQAENLYILAYCEFTWEV